MAVCKTVGYDIVFQEIPDEISLAINISNCPFRCPGCHSPYLQEDIGEELTTGLLQSWIEKYAGEITCVLFMGGDKTVSRICELSKFVKQNYPGLKTAWYSGRETTDCFQAENFDFVKFGPYKEKLGGLKSKTTNQRLYKIKDGRFEDITSSFWN